MRTSLRVILPAALCAALLLSACDFVGRLDGQDPLETTIRDNPMDPGATNVVEISQALPDGTVVGTSRPTFTFEYSDGIVRYTLQISASSDFSGDLLVKEEGITEEAYRISTALADHGTYYWRALPGFSDNRDRGWSSVHSFSIDIPAPVTRELSYCVKTPFPTFYWDYSQGISEAELCLSQASDFAIGSVTVAVSGNSYKWPGALEDAKIYYWRMRSIDSGIPSDWGKTFTFSIFLPRPSDLYPSSGQGVSSNNPTFKWATYNKSNSDFIGYQFQIDTSSSFEAPLTYDAGSSDPDKIAEYKTFTPPLNLQNNQQYYWRVRTKYSETQFGQWVESSFFKNRVERIIEASVTGYELVFDTTGALCVRGYTTAQLFSPSGSILWQQSIGDSCKSCIAEGLGIFTISNSPADVRLYDFLGNEAWSFSSTEYYNFCEPALWADGGICFARGFASGYTLYAVDRFGHEKWSFAIGNNSCNPVIGDDECVYIFSDYAIQSLHSDGEEKWKTALPPSYYQCCSLVIGTQGRVFLSCLDSDSGKTYALSPTDGSILWTAQLPWGFISEPVVGIDGTLYLSANVDSNSGWHIVAINPDDGSRKWDITCDAQYLMRPGILGNDGVLYFRYSGGIIALQANDGSEVWRTPLETDGWYDATMSADGSIYLTAVGNSTQKSGFYIIPTTATGLADSPWPTSRHDSQRTGRAGS